MIEQDFADFMAPLVTATLGQDLWIGEVPNSNKIQDSIWWIITDGGIPLPKNATGERFKDYQLVVYRRGKDYKEVLQAISSFEDYINSVKCVTLSDAYDTINIDASTLGVDDDLDVEDRKVASLRVTITTYKEL